MNDLLTKTHNISQRAKLEQGLAALNKIIRPLAPLSEVKRKVDIKRVGERLGRVS